MIKIFICEEETCEQKDIEFRLTDPMPVTTCGGCQKIISGQEVNE